MNAFPETLDRTTPVQRSWRSDLALIGWQVAYEQRAFWRNRTRAFFSFGMPIMLLLIFASLNTGRIEQLHDIKYVVFFLPGIMAYGIIITQFVNMAGGLAIQRDNGLLKRMRGTPLPGWAYVTGRVGSTALSSVAMAAVMLAIGEAFYGVHLRAEAIPAIVITVLLGAATFAALGMAAVSLIPNAEAAPVVANVLILPLSFISGIWYPLDGAPDWITTIAHIFPLYHIVNAFDACFVPQTTGGGWSPSDLAVIAAWGIGATWVAVRRFHAEPAGGEPSRLRARFAA
jgi:ABC-2 type transport system permease protein